MELWSSSELFVVVVVVVGISSFRSSRLVLKVLNISGGPPRISG